MSSENGDGIINLFLQHGWGFAGSSWQGFLPGGDGYNHFLADRGYFGSPVSFPEGPVPGTNVTICHSLGLHLLESRQLAQTDLLVILAGFRSFHGETVADGRFSRRHVARMLAELPVDPLMLLNKFYHDCSFAGGVDDPAAINTALLHRDLLILDRHSLDPAAVRQIPRVLIVHGVLDRIVPLERGRQLAASLASATFIEVEGAGHGLPFTHPRQCRQIINKALSSPTVSLP